MIAQSKLEATQRQTVKKKSQESEEACQAYFRKRLIQNIDILSAVSGYNC